MTARRRIALYFDLGFEQDRRLFARLAPYMRRKRANEIIKAALQAWVERQERLEEPAGPIVPPNPMSSGLGDMQVATGPGSGPGVAGGIRDLVERIAAQQPERAKMQEATQSQSPSPPNAAHTGVGAIPSSATPPVSASSKPRLGRLM